MRNGDTLVVTEIDRLAQSLPDARGIADELTRKGATLNLGGSVYDPTDLVSLHRAGTHTTSEIAELFGAARSTVYPTCESWGLTPADLAGDDHARCQETATATRADGYEAIRYPSAAVARAAGGAPEARARRTTWPCSPTCCIPARTCA